MLAVAALLSACGAERIVSGGRAVSPQEISALAASGRVAEVHGHPPDGAAAEVIAASIRVPGFNNDRPFALVQGGSRGLRMVLEFGVGTGTNDSCRIPRGSALQGPIVLAATLCRDEALVSSATLRSETLRGPSDPAWHGAMDRLMLSVLQREERRHFRDD
jgi:hypothetical protein